MPDSDELNQATEKIRVFLLDDHEIVRCGIADLINSYAAAGAAPDPRLPSDGIDLGPQLTGAAPVARTLYWRYKAHAQRAVRDGALKYLKIDGNEYLFDVVTDPLERANLKGRRPDDFARLRALWRTWNATMLPETPDSYTEGVSAAIQADHLGAQPVDRRAVDPGD